MALGLTVHSMWNKKLVDISQKATKYDESVLDNKMNVNAAKEPIFFFHPRIFTPCTGYLMAKSKKEFCSERKKYTS